MNIFTACETGNLDWLKQQKAAGTLPYLMQKDDRCWYPHEYAAANGHLAVIKWLVKESGQPVDVTADNNWTVHYAAANGHLAVVKWLVEESGQPVAVTANDNNAVRHAALNGHLDVVKWAAENGHTAVVDYLNVVTPLIQAVGLTVCRSVGFDAVSEMLTTQAKSKSTTHRL